MPNSKAKAYPHPFTPRPKPNKATKAAHSAGTGHIGANSGANEATYSPAASAPQSAHSLMTWAVSQIRPEKA